MNNETPRPGQIFLPKRAQNRNKFEALKNVTIDSVEEAAVFVDILAKKLPDLQRVLSKARVQGVYAQSQNVRSRMTNPISGGESHDTEVKPGPVDVGTAAQNQTKTMEARRLEQLRAAQSAIQSSAPQPQVQQAKPVPMPDISKGNNQPVQIQPPEQTGDVLTTPTGLPMNPDEETEMSRTTPVEPESPAEEPQEAPKENGISAVEKRKEALAKAREARRKKAEKKAQQAKES